MRTMLDLGAHKGTDTAYYAEAGFKVIAVEAHPELARRLATVWVGRPDQVRVLHRAITPDGKEAHLFTSSKGEEGETHSIYPHRVKECERLGFTVPGTTVGRLLEMHGVPFYMKVDIEGADVVAIRQLHEYTGGWDDTAPGFKHNTFTNRAPPAYLSVELDWDHPEEALEIFSHLAYMGYNLFRIVGQYNPEGTAKTCPIETVELWRYHTLRDTIADWFDGSPPTGRWYDLHARHNAASPLDKDAP